MWYRRRWRRGRERRIRTAWCERITLMRYAEAVTATKQRPRRAPRASTEKRTTLRVPNGLQAAISRVQTRNRLTPNAALLWLASLGAEQIDRIEAIEALADANREAWEHTASGQAAEAARAAAPSDEEWADALSALRRLAG